MYFLVAEDLKLLHDEYDVNYETLMKNSAQAAIKVRAAAPLISVPPLKVALNFNTI